MLSLALFTLLAIDPTLAVPDAPAHGPQLAARGSQVALTFGTSDGIYFSQSQDAGKTFSRPKKVAGAEILPLTHHRGPRIAFAGPTIVISAVAGKTLSEGLHAHGLPSDGDLLVWRSTDSGKSWSKAITVNDVPAAPTEGLHALAAGASGSLFAVWLDKRTGKGTKLYSSHSADAGLTWSKSVPVYESPDGTICECCHPSATIGADGQIAVMWRNWLGGSRDMYLARSRDGVAFSKPEKLGVGTWELNACPMDGGGVAISGDRVFTAWRRHKEIFIDTPGQPEVSVGEGSDVSITAAKNGFYAVWSTPKSLMALLPGRKEAVSLGAKGTFPNVVALTNGHAVATWEEEGKIVTHLID